MNDDEKPAEQPTGSCAVDCHRFSRGQPLNQPHTIDVQAQKVEEPIRKDV
jgi:sec-independent protein translocase protein TatA